MQGKKNNKKGERQLKKIYIGVLEELPGSQMQSSYRRVPGRYPLLYFVDPACDHAGMTIRLHREWKINSL